MSKSNYNPSIIRVVIGGAVCVYAVVNFLINLNRPNYIGLVVLFVVGFLIMASGMYRKYSRRDLIKEMYAADVAADSQLHTRKALADALNVVGLLLIVTAIVWIYAGIKYLELGSNLVLAVAAGIGLIGLILIGNSNVATGVGWYHAIRRSRAEQERKNKEPDT